MNDQDASAKFQLIGELATAMGSALADIQTKFLDDVSDAYAKQIANRDTP